MLLHDKDADDDDALRMATKTVMTIMQYGNALRCKTHVMMRNADNDNHHFDDAANKAAWL